MLAAPTPGEVVGTPADAEETRAPERYEAPAPEEAVKDLQMESAAPAGLHSASSCRRLSRAPMHIFWGPRFGLEGPQSHCSTLYVFAVNQTLRIISTINLASYGD